VAALAVAVVLLVTSVLATVVWAQAGSEESALAVVREPGRREVRGWPDRSETMDERMDERHDWMNGAGCDEPFWFDE
jgi:cytochrome c-type biogenesis protein CcmH/NrfG